MISGHCGDGFSQVQQALEDNLISGADLGAGVSVFVNGELVVDLRGGFADRQKTTPFADTLVCVYSSGKAMTSALIMAAVAAGALDYDRPIAEDWPEFAAAGKGHITLGDALSHQSGVSAFTYEVDPMIWLDWSECCAALAVAAPAWPPSSGQSGYGPQTFGYIVGEVYRRATGQTIGEALRATGADIHCGLSATTQERVGRMVKPSAPPDLGPLTDLKKAAFLTPWSSPTKAAREDWLAAEIPAANMHGTSLGLATIMQAFATGEHWGGTMPIPEHVRSQAMEQRVRSNDLVLPFDLSWGAGVMRNVDGVLGPSPSAVGHYGFGGSCTMADPNKGLSFAYVPNKMSPALVKDPRALAIMEAVYASI